MGLQPRFEEKESFLLVGFADYGAFFETGEIPMIWDRFVKVMQEVPNRINPSTSYGVEFYTEECLAMQKWNYMAAVEVSTLEDIPITMVGKVIPARLYAVFTHKGRLDGISHTFRAIYDEWLPTSDYQPDGSFDFEFYGERFRGDTAESEVDIYLPVVRKPAE